MSKKRKFDTKKLMGTLPYLVAGILTIALVFVGSIDKHSGSTNLSLDAFAENNYKVSVDQLSELYVVADLSDALGLASATDVATNYVITTTMYRAGQVTSTSGKLEKPNITNIAVSRGVISHVVAEGESMEAIAAKYGVSTDEIRWSNGLKTTAVSAGTLLYVPSAPGIVYTVKAGETAESIAAKYGSTAAEIIALNDLEVSGVSEGMRILIRGGTLPAIERPEYIAPVQRSNYTYVGSSATRRNVQVIARGFYDSRYAYPYPNPGVAGQCTWYAWYWRATDPASLGELNHNGRNAGTWHRDYAYRGVGREPRVGAVFQTSAGGNGLGHVGVVVGINNDGSIVVREMNYAGSYVVTEATIPAAYVGNYNYIY